MFIIYDDLNKPPFHGRSALNINPTKAYLKHYSNYLFLEFITKRSQDRSELHQARKELTICERKLAYWKKVPGWESARVATEVEKLKKQWAGS
jgi:hypothetical protein